MAERMVNVPLAKTFGWLHLNGTAVQVEEEPKREEVILSPGESRVVRWDGTGLFRAELPEGAMLQLIQIRQGGMEVQVNDLQVRCGANSRFEWFRLAQGGKRTMDNCSVTLAGDGSSFEAWIGYRLKGQEQLDMNCEAIHLGKRTKSRITASGALEGQAAKIFRGTIDLRKGCAGAVGSEMEDVLLLEDTVCNSSLPVILCAEEDVEGNHGATIGRPDESLVYYLTSRGIEERDVYELLAQAKIDSILRHVPDENIQAELRERAAAMEEEGT